MKNPIIWGYLSCLILSGCTESIRESYRPEEEATVISLPVSSVPSMEKSLVFFFRKLEKGDTLVCCREIEGPREDFSIYSFQLPAGYYQMIFIGNGEMEHIRFEGTPSVENGIIDYSDGTQPPDLYFTRNYVQAGETNRIGAGILILSSRIALTVRDIPSGIARVKINLQNTIAGVSMTLVNLPEATHPAISTEISVVPHSSPVIHLKSLASYPEGGRSFLEVFCYDAQGKIAYQGQSEPFRLGGSEDIQISCRFDAAPLSTGSSLPQTKGQQMPDFVLTKEK